MPYICAYCGSVKALFCRHMKHLRIYLTFQLLATLTNVQMLFTDMLNIALNDGKLQLCLNIQFPSKAARPPPLESQFLQSSLRNLCVVFTSVMWYRWRSSYRRSIPAVSEWSGGYGEHRRPSDRGFLAVRCVLRAESALSAGSRCHSGILTSLLYFFHFDYQCVHE